MANNLNSKIIHSHVYIHYFIHFTFYVDLIVIYTVHTLLESTLNKCYHHYSRFKSYYTSLIIFTTFETMKTLTTTPHINTAKSMSYLLHKS